MKPYEIAYLLFEPFLPVLHRKVRKDLRACLRDTLNDPVRILDVGGRKSPYTIGLSACVTILDLPRDNEIQHRLHLGLTKRILYDLRKKRSNIERVILEDMTKCTLPSDSYDVVVAIEVIEHVLDDESFMAQVYRVIKPGGCIYLTTPNGDYIRNAPPHFNPDHIRHYRREELGQLLNKHFDRTNLWYGVKTGKYRYRGLQGFSWKKPGQVIITMVCNLINWHESKGLNEQSRRTAHLFAICWKDK